MTDVPNHEYGFIEVGQDTIFTNLEHSLLSNLIFTYYKGFPIRHCACILAGYVSPQGHSLFLLVQ